LTFAPEINEQPQNITISSGETASFSVEASGTRPLTYQWQVSTTWYNNWNDISDDAIYSGVNTSTLTLTNTPYTYNGYRYQCIVSNSAGSVTSYAAELTVQYAPIIEHHPQDMTLNAGGYNDYYETNFYVSANSTPSPTYQWQVNDGSGWKDLAVDFDIYWGITWEYLYVYYPPASYNGYKYRCAVSHTQGTTYSDAATLTVLTFAPEINEQPQNITVQSGNNAYFYVGAYGAPNELTFQWQIRKGKKNWINITNDDLYSGSDNYEFLINANRSLNGNQYRCIVTNSEGSVISDIVTINVQRNSQEIITFCSLIMAMVKILTLCAGGFSIIWFLTIKPKRIKKKI